MDKSLLDKINYTNLPQHIAIIMDGNGRWAKRRLMPRTIGHRAGMKTLKSVVRLCSDINIPVLTVYAFSTENWKRPQREIDFLMNLNSNPRRFKSRLMRSDRGVWAGISPALRHALTRDVKST